MVLDDEKKIKEGLEPQLAEYKVMQKFWNKDWDATQRYYEVEEGEQLRDLDIHAQKYIKQDGAFFKFDFRLEMYISIKYRQNFTFVGVKWPTSNPIAEERVIQVLDPNFYQYENKFSRIYYLPEAPAPLFEDTYEIYTQSSPNSQRFSNKDIYSYAKKLFEAWYSKSLYGYAKSWSEISFDKIINESWLSLFKDFMIEKLSENRDHHPDNQTLGKMFLEEKKMKAVEKGRPTFFGVIRVPLLVVGSESCKTLEFKSETGSLEEYKSMDWIKCHNYFFPLDNDQVRFGFYFMPLNNISQFIDEFESYAQTWIQYFIKKEELFLSMWWSTIVDMHLADFK